MIAPTYDELAAVVVGLQVRIAEQDAETSPRFAHQRVKTSPAGSSGVLAVLIAPTHRSRSQSITDREQVSCRGAGRGGDPRSGATPCNVQPFLMWSRTVLVVATACGLVLPAVPAQAAPEPCAAGYVRLTFDDGPNRTATPDILDTLAAHRVTATFFVVGHMTVANPALVQRESREGHTIGNHSWDHPDLTTLNRGQVESELQDTNDVIEQVTGTTPTQWRPPYGATNPVVEAAATDVGLTSMVLWTVDPRDWADPPATTVRDRVLQAVRPDSIILLHDGTGANTPEALPMILTGLADMGYCVR